LSAAFRALRRDGRPRWRQYRRQAATGKALNC